jgi:RNA polymerase sigma-70 factor (ECF subfamily)
VEGHLAAWLFTVARNRALELKRRDGREDRLPEEDDVKSPDSGPQSKAERAQAMTRVSKLLEQLPEQQREAVLLKFAGDLSYRSIRPQAHW